MVMGTRAAELALLVVYESPLQVICDSPDAYRGQAGTSFLKETPATWDETRVLAGEVGQYIAVARRSGKRWFVGAITGSESRTLDIPLDFLGGDGLWKARIVADAPEAWVSPERATEDTWTVRPIGKLTAHMAPGAGSPRSWSPRRRSDQDLAPQRQSPRGRRMRPTLMARAAGESFIGSVVRRMPSKASSAPATAAAVGTRPISPDALRAERALGLGLLDQDHLDLRHVARAQDADLAQAGRHRHPVLAGQLLGERVAEAHVDGALDLPLAERGVHHAAHVVRRDHALDAAGSSRITTCVAKPKDVCVLILGTSAPSAVVSSMTTSAA